MNWVERRFLSRSILRERAVDVWNDVRSSFQDACASYNEHRQPEAPEVSCLLENGHRIRITFAPAGKRKLILLISFDSAKNSIAIVADRPGEAPVQCPILADELEAYPTIEGGRVSPDEFSRHILEPWFFPDSGK
jgi:hypothetical protein